jgi:uncharacterized membrane protein YfcA
MEILMSGLTPAAFVAALAVTFFAGFVKGAVGFAMPMIMISAFSSFLTPDMALVGLILPTLVTNLSQAFRQGAGEAWQTTRDYWRFLLPTVVFIGLSAQAVHLIPQSLFLMGLGLPITAFALLQIAGRSLAIPVRHRDRAALGLGMIGGLYGGVSGVWGPPLLVYLLSIGASKAEMVRVQGVVFLIGAIALLLAHLQSGLVNSTTLPFSAALVGPALLGLALGYTVQDRLDQRRFRWWTQLLLVLTGLNLVRRAAGL